MGATQKDLALTSGTGLRFVINLERGKVSTTRMRSCRDAACFGLAPIFEMNLPEGVLRERLRLAFAKATGTFDEFDLLAVVGRSQVDRIRHTGQKEQLDKDIPFQSVDEILAHRRDADLFIYLIEKLESLSGISGVQPKILARDEEAFRVKTRADSLANASNRICSSSSA